MNHLHLPVFSYASSIVIETELLRFGKGYTQPSVCEMIFDTGATMTAIDEEIATRWGYKWKDGKDTTVAGIGNAAMPAKMIIIPSLILDGYDIGPNSLHVIKFPEDANTKAVLGMNVIRNFKTTIDIKMREDEDYDVTKPIGLITLTPKFAMNDKPKLEDFLPNNTSVWNLERG